MITEPLGQIEANDQSTDSEKQPSTYPSLPIPKGSQPVAGGRERMRVRHHRTTPLQKKTAPRQGCHISADLERIEIYPLLTACRLRPLEREE